MQKALLIDSQYESKLNKLGIYLSEDDVPKNSIANDIAPNIDGKTFVNAYYLNISDGAFLQGHAAILLEISDGQGYYYSVTGDRSQGLGTVLGGRIPGGVVV